MTFVNQATNVYQGAATKIHVQESTIVQKHAEKTQTVHWDAARLGIVAHTTCVRVVNQRETYVIIIESVSLRYVQSTKRLNLTLHKGLILKKSKTVQMLLVSYQKTDIFNMRLLMIWILEFVKK